VFWSLWSKDTLINNYYNTRVYSRPIVIHGGGYCYVELSRRRK